MSDEQEISKLRERIDGLDARLLALLNERAQCAIDVAAVKKKSDGEATSFYRPEREAEILRRLQTDNGGPLSGDAVIKLFREIMSACLALEESVPIGFLGPEGTFTYAATLKHFGHAAKTVGLTSIGEVFKQVEAQSVTYGVVPIENSIEGVVTHTLDRFVQSPLKIVGEVMVPIQHNLISLADSLNRVQTIYSHQHSFSQCRQWIAEHLPHCEHIYTNSTADAVLRAKEAPTAAAIAGIEAAQRYEVPVLCSHIEDFPDNVTRFLVIGNQMTAPSGHDKTSILVSAENRPGALADLLEPLARNKVSMTRIESRPIKTVNWEYVFFIDMQGHCDDQNVARALDELKGRAVLLKLLGSYPSAVA